MGAEVAGQQRAIGHDLRRSRHLLDRLRLHDGGRQPAVIEERRVAREPLDPHQFLAVEPAVGPLETDVALPGNVAHPAIEGHDETLRSAGLRRCVTGPDASSGGLFGSRFVGGDTPEASPSQLTLAAQTPLRALTPHPGRVFVTRPFKVVLLAVLALLLLGPLPNSLAGAPRPRLRAPSNDVRALDVAPDTSAGYGTGTILHADALRTGKNALVDLDVAFSGAAYSSAAATAEVTNEVHRVVAAKLGANAGFGRGTALELGIGSDPIPLIGQLSEAAAPPSTGLIEKVIGPLGVPGVDRRLPSARPRPARPPTPACSAGTRPTASAPFSTSRCSAGCCPPSPGRPAGRSPSRRRAPAS